MNKQIKIDNKVSVEGFFIPLHEYEYLIEDGLIPMNPELIELNGVITAITKGGVIVQFDEMRQEVNNEDLLFVDHRTALERLSVRTARKGRLMDMKAPQNIIDNEQLMIDEANRDLEQSK